jgi:urea transport system ATP-binding protein
LDVITGKVQPTTGTARFKGQDLSNRSEHAIARLGIGRKFQTPRVLQNLTARENLELSSNANKGVFPTLFGKSSRTERRQINGLLETVGLAAKADIEAGLLSHGEKQWLEIGMLVAQNPDLLLVDEPVAGLTDEETELTGELLLSLAESHSIVVIEHDMEFVRQIARQVTVLHQGSVLCEGTMNQVQNDPRVIEVYLGDAPTVTPAQMASLKIAALIADTDGDLSSEEMNQVLHRLSQRFAQDAEHQAQLKQVLRDSVSQDLALSDLVADLTSAADRELALRLSYDVLCAYRVNPQEAATYQQLLPMLDLPPETVQRLEADVQAGVAR